MQPTRSCFRLPGENVSFEQVRFGYSDDKILMENIDFRIQAGSQIAVVGPTGAGKTTLVNLLMRFYELQGGRITIDGVNIRDMNRKELRSILGMDCRIPGCLMARSPRI